MVGPLFTSNYTVLTPYDPSAIESMELVTVDYIGNLTGDPAGGATRILCNNVFTANLGGTTAYFLGQQAGPGQPLMVDYAAPNATGMIDWGAFTPNGQGVGVAGLSATGNGAYKMARTLSSSPNQVAIGGRRVMTAWLDGGAAASQVRWVCVAPRQQATFQEHCAALLPPCRRCRVISRWILTARGCCSSFPRNSPPSPALATAPAQSAGGGGG